MVELIVGGKGKGKTKQLLNRAAEAVKTANGNIVYIDRSSQHMYELSNRIRLINISRFPVHSEDAYIGFLSGVLSQDHDLEYIFLDGFLTVANLMNADITGAVKRILDLSERCSVNIIVSVSMDADKLPDELKDLVTISL